MRWILLKAGMPKIKYSLCVMLLYACNPSAAEVLALDSALDNLEPTEKLLRSYDSSALLDDDSAFCESGTSRSCVLKRKRCWEQNNLVALPTISARAVDKTQRADGDACIKPALGELTPQAASNNLSFYTSISGQRSSQLLDFSKKIEQSYGYVVQPYPEYAESLSQGYVLSVEARLLLPNFFEQELGELQLISFVETAAMTQSTSTWVDGMNPRALTGAGIGVNFTYKNNHEFKAYLVHKVGNGVAVAAQPSSNKIAVQASKYF